MTNMPLEEAILETWRVHNRSMLFLIENLPEKAFSCTLSQRGGRTIAAQLSHCIDVRFYRMDSFVKKNNIAFTPFEKGYIPNRAELLNAFEDSGNIMDKMMLESLKSGGEAPHFARGIVVMIGYYISHEAHHRGHALLTAKTQGISLPDSLKWGVWEWNKL
ncbi:MAG: DinB family protein [Sphingomonadales bacterium]|jgi:hypothetical protein